MGPAEESHPEEVLRLTEHIKALGAELIRTDEENLVYSPGLSPGMPGQVFISKNASYGAWLHEVKHLDDDAGDGWLGMRVFMDTDRCIQRERDAYQIEIDLALSYGSPEIAARLEALRDAEIRKYEK